METVLRLHFVKQCIVLNLVVIQYSPYRSPPVSSSRLNSGSMLGSRRREGASVRSRIYTTSGMERSMLYPPSTVRTQPRRPKTVSTQRHYSFYSSNGIACRNESDVVNEIRAQDDYRYYHVN